ncbi:MAG: DUF2934 domain-containing protein [Gemmataceae bacterium]
MRKKSGTAEKSAPEKVGRVVPGKAMPVSGDRVVPEEEIRRRAYQIWEAAGKPVSDGVRFWLEAEGELFQAK